MRYLYVILVILTISGCSSKSSSYLLPSDNLKVVATIKTQIGVKKIEVPNYLNSDKILIQEGSKVTEANSNFVAPPSELLTQKSIAILKSSLNNPNVWLYPWDIKEKKGYIVEIVLDKFIYKDAEAVVSGSYYIKDANGNLLVSKNFIKQEPSKKDSKSIVNNLSTLFTKVVIEIAQKIARWYKYFSKISKKQLKVIYE